MLLPLALVEVLPDEEDDDSDDEEVDKGEGVLFIDELFGVLDVDDVWLFTSVIEQGGWISRCFPCVEGDEDAVDGTADDEVMIGEVDDWIPKEFCCGKLRLIRLLTGDWTGTSAEDITFEDKWSWVSLIDFDDR